MRAWRSAITDDPDALDRCDPAFIARVLPALEPARAVAARVQATMQTALEALRDG